MNAVFWMGSLERVDLGPILSEVTSVNDPTSLNLDSGLFADRGKHVLTNCCGQPVSENAL